MKGSINRIIIGKTLLAIKIAIAVVLILIAVVPAVSVQGVSTTLTESYCASPLNGSWATNGVCTIPAGSSGSIPAGDVLGLNDYTQIIVNGTLTVNGKLTLQGGTLGTNSGGTITNNGAIEHRTSATGGLNNFGTFNNNGSLLVATGATFANYSIFTNSATLTVNGEFDTYAQAGVNGSFTNTNTGVNNIMAGGYYFGAANTSTVNNGAININRNFSTYVQGSMSVHGSLTNAGTITNVGIFRAKNLTNTNTGTLYNDSYGDLQCSESNSTLINEGTFTNRYLFRLTDGCIFTNKSTGTFNNQGITYIGEDMGTSAGAGTLLNEGTLNNTYQIILVAWGVDAGIELHNENGAVITNDSGGVIELGKSSHLYNTGLIEHKNGVIKGGTTGDGILANYRWEDPWDGDPGVINKYCAGSILVAVSGPAPIDLCAGTIVINKSTELHLGDDFTFSGSGSLGTFTLDGDYDTTVPSTRTFSGLTLGSYTVIEAEATGFTLTGLVCTSTEGSADTTGTNLSTRTATIDLDGGETVTCTFTNSINTCTPPAVTDQPDNVGITYGQNASFTVAGTNYTSVQWQVNSGSGWSNIAGATATTYTLTKPAVSLSGNQYKAILTGDCTPAATSTAATLTVNKAQVTATAGSYSGTYDGTAHSPSACAVTGTYTGDLSCTNSPTSVGPGVGTGIITPVVNGTGLTNYTITSVNGSWGITPAPVTATAGSYSGTYNGTSHSPLACAVTGTYTGDLSCTNDPASVGPDVGSGDVVPTLVLNGETETNFTVTSQNGSWEIMPAAVTITAGDYNGIYDGTSHSPLPCVVTGAYTGGLSCTNDPASVGPDVGSGNVVPTLVLNGETETNFTVTSQNGAWEIAPAAVTITAGDYSGTYDGTAHSPSTCAVTGTYTGDLSCTNDPASVGPDVGSGDVVPVLVQNGEIETNFTVTSQNVAWEITPAPVTLTAGSYSSTYDGAAHSPSVCAVTGTYMGDLSCTNGPASVGPDVGSGSVVPVLVLNGETETNFTVTSQNGAWEITPAAVTITAGDYNGIYDGTSHSPSDCTVSGAYTGGLSCMNDPASVGPDVGSGSVVAVLVLNGEIETNFTVTSQNGAWEITPAAVTITAGNYNGTYDGVTHSPSACVVTGDYKGDLSCTNDPASVGPDVGSGIISPTVNGIGLTNYTITSINGSWSIEHAYVDANAGSYSGTYDGLSHKPTACLVTGVYTGDLYCINMPSTVGPNVGSGTIRAAVGGTGLSNYAFRFSAGSWEITPAAVTITAGDYNGTYDGVAHPPSECTVAGDYKGDLSCTNSPAMVGPDVGSGDVVPVLVLNGEIETNFTVTSQNGSWEITPAAVTIAAGDYNGIYDGVALSPSDCTVSGAYTGGLSCTNDPASVGPDVGSGSVLPVLILNSETEANFTVTPQNGSWSITSAEPTCSISGYTGVYDGHPHGASGTCTGVLGETLLTLNLGDSFTNVPGGTASWTFTDTSGNYNNDSGWVEIVIGKADPICSISGYTGVYDGDPHGASGSCTGVKGEVLTTLDLGESFTEVPGGTAYWTFTDTSGNYNDDSGSAKIVIIQATLIVTADNQTAQYSDITPPLTFSYSGFVGSDDPDDLTTKPSCSTTREILDQAGDYFITCSGGEDNNYTFSYVGGTFTVTKENATVTFDNDNPAALQVSTTGGTLAANELTLVLKVIEKLPDLPADKAAAGEINNAGLKVKLEPLSGGGAITLDCTAAVEGTGYEGVKTFTCTNSAPLAVDTYDVIALVDGDYYIGESYDGFTVYDPSLGFASGGGWFYWPGTTEKTTFGFTMKYNKKAKNVQGNLLIIRHHADGTISRLKSNALDGLAIKNSNGCGIATFSGKATYMTWDSEANEGLGGYVNTGGNPFSVYVEDCNQPGTGVDRFWVRSVDKLMMAKPASTNAVTIGGGNIVVPHKPK